MGFIKVNNFDAKLYVFSILTGAVVGVACVCFRLILGWAVSMREWFFLPQRPFYIHLLIAILVYGILLLVHYMIAHYPETGGNGMAQTRAAMIGRLTYRKGTGPFWAKFLGGIASIGSGLSLGREGPSVQMGGFLGHLMANQFGLKPARKKHLIAAGAGAGISAAFTAPLSSAILIVESIERYDTPKIIITTLLAGITSGIIAILLIPENPYQQIPVNIPDHPFFELLLIFIVFALLFSFLGAIFSEFLLRFKRLFGHWRMPFAIKLIALIGSIWIMGMLFPRLTGGDQHYIIEQSYTFTESPWVIATGLVLMILFTALSNAPSFPGGTFLPMMSIGGLAGKLFAQGLIALNFIVPETTGYFILLGMSACFIAVVRTPLTGFVLVSEMTGHFELFFSTLVVGTLVYYFTELMGVEPLNERLYKMMLKKLEPLSPERTTIFVEVITSSYLEKKVWNEVWLPKGCSIASIQRDGEGLPLTNNTTLLAGDQVGIELNSCDLETLYQPLTSLAISS